MTICFRTLCPTCLHPSCCRGFLIPYSPLLSSNDLDVSMGKMAGSSVALLALVPRTETMALSLKLRDPFASGNLSIHDQSRPLSFTSIKWIMLICYSFTFATMLLSSSAAPSVSFKPCTITDVCCWMLWLLKSLQGNCSKRLPLIEAPNFGITYNHL